MTFENEVSFQYLIVLIILVVGFLLKEILRSNKKRLVYRLAASLLIFIGLAGILFKPTYLSKSFIKKVVVLTSGYNNEVLDSLQHVENLAVASLDELQKNAVGEIILYGHGLEEYEFERLKEMRVNYFPPKKMSGITSVFYNKNQIRNKKAIIKGTCNCIGNSKIVLVSSVGRVDSALNVHDFEFVISAKTIGKQLLYIEYWEDSLLVDRNPIPLLVKVPESLRVLMLNSSPNFEANHIKKYLGKHQHTVAIRNRVSDNRFSFEFINQKRYLLRTIDRTILQNVDIIFIDQQEWNNLTNNELQLIKNEVKNGLGVLLYGISDDSFSKGLFTNFSVKKNTQEQLEGYRYNNANITKNEYSFAMPELLIPFINNSNSIQSAYQIVGRGKIGVLLSSQTYQLNFKGEHEAYALYWSKHIDVLVDGKNSDNDFTMTPTFLWENQPMHLAIVTTGTIPKIEIEGDMISMAQSVFQDEIWNGKYWPQNTGWHKISNVNTSDYFYVFENKDWKTLRSAQKTTNNLRYFSGQNVDNTQKFVKKLVPLYVAFLIFLIGITFLWFEAKL